MVNRDLSATVSAPMMMTRMDQTAIGMAVPPTWQRIKFRHSDDTHAAFECRDVNVGGTTKERRHRERVWPALSRYKRRHHKRRWVGHRHARIQRAIKRAALLSVLRRWDPMSPLEAWHMKRCDHAQRPAQYDPW